MPTPLYHQLLRRNKVHTFANPGIYTDMFSGIYNLGAKPTGSCRVGYAACVYVYDGCVKAGGAVRL